MKTIVVLIENEEALENHVKGYKEMSPIGYTSVEKCKDIIRRNCDKHIEKFGSSCPDIESCINVMDGWDKCHWFEPVELTDITGEESNYLYRVEYKGILKG